MLATAAGTLVTACGGSAPAAAVTGPASAHLLTIDQLVAPDFTVDVAPHELTAANLTAAGAGPAGLLSDNGFVGAAAEDFYRSDRQLARLNGPAQISDTVEVFANREGAAAVLATDIGRLDGVAGSRAVSTGVLGDAAHAVRRAAVAGGITVVEFTVEWQVVNVLDVLVVRGREGGTRADDALLLAHVQTAAELHRAGPSG